MKLENGGFFPRKRKDLQKKKSIDLFLATWDFVAACRLSPAAASRGYSLVAVHGVLTAVASLFVTRALEQEDFTGLGSGSQALSSAKV